MNAACGTPTQDSQTPVHRTIICDYGIYVPYTTTAATNAPTLPQFLCDAQEAGNLQARPMCEGCSAAFQMIERISIPNTQRLCLDARPK